MSIDHITKSALEKKIFPDLLNTLLDTKIVL